MEYLEVDPPEFFEPLKDHSDLKSQLTQQLQQLDEEQLEKVETFIRWMK